MFPKRHVTKVGILVVLTCGGLTWASMNGTEDDNQGDIGMRKTLAGIDDKLDTRLFATLASLSISAAAFLSSKTRPNVGDANSAELMKLRDVSQYADFIESTPEHAKDDVLLYIAGALAAVRFKQAFYCFAVALVYSLSLDFLITEDYLAEWLPVGIECTAMAGATLVGLFCMWDGAKMIQNRPPFSDLDRLQDWLTTLPRSPAQIAKAIDGDRL